MKISEMTETHETATLAFWHDPELNGATLVHARYGAHCFERHVHDEMVIAVTEAGFGHAQARNLSDVIRPGAIWVSGAGEYHSGKVDGGKHWDYRAFYLDEDALLSLTSVFHYEREERTFPIPHGVYFDPQVARLLIDVHKKAERDAPLLERQSLWWSAFGLLFGRHGNLKINNRKEGSEKSALKLARDYIAAHYMENISVDKLAALVGLSRYYFIRAFRAEYGLPPHAYANQLRLAAARKLLASGASPVDVASLSGFYDQSHLNRLFKRNFGMTPGKYAEARCPVSSRVVPLKL
jgi:AraC-like DNA-binding protein